MTSQPDTIQRAAVRGVSLMLAMLVACIGLTLNPQAIYADATSEPDWYDGETPWDELDPEEQKLAYDEQIDVYKDGQAADVALYDVRRNQIIQKANDLAEAANDEGLPPPPAFPEPPEMKPNDDDPDDWSDFEDAYQDWVNDYWAWRAALTDWYDGLTQEQKDKIDFDELRDAVMDAHLDLQEIVAVHEAKLEQINQLEEAKCAHCKATDAD